MSINLLFQAELMEDMGHDGQIFLFVIDRQQNRVKQLTHGIDYI